MTTDKKSPPPPVVRVADRGPLEEFSHPWNPASLIRGHSLSEKAGLQRLGVHCVTIPPGKESFELHAHHFEEEWLYVLSGRGSVEIDGAQHELAAGDFVGFPAPSAAHQLRNPGSEDLVYLSGGERLGHEVADFPRLRKRMVRVGGKFTIYPLDAGEPFPGLEKVDEPKPPGR